MYAKFSAQSVNAFMLAKKLAIFLTHPVGQAMLPANFVYDFGYTQLFQLHQYRNTRHLEPDGHRTRHFGDNS